MATTLTFTPNPYPNGFTNDQRWQRVFGTGAITSGTYPAGGYSIVWSSQEGIKSNLPPVTGSVIMSSVADPPSGYQYFWDATSQKVRVFQGAGSAAPGAEISGAVPAGVIADVIGFQLAYPRD